MNSCSLDRRMSRGVEESSIPKHSEKNAKQAVGEGSESLGVRESSSSATVVEVTGGGVVGEAAHGPGVQSIAQPLVAGASHDDNASLAALLGDRSEPTESSGGVVVSLAKRLRSLGEHRGADEFPHAWYGEEDLRVAMLVLAGFGVFFAKLSVKFSDIPLGLTNLLVSELDSREQGADVLRGGLDATRSQAQGRLGQNGVKLSCGESSNPIHPEEFCELSFAKPSSLMRSGSEQQERPQPRLVCGVT
jgi:hypothetical protein